MNDEISVKWIVALTVISILVVGFFERVPA